MNEQYDENLLLGYVEDDLTASQRATVEKWIARDPRLARLLEQMQADRQLLRDMPEPDAPDWLMDDVDRGLERSMLLDATVADMDISDVDQQYTVRRVFVGMALAATLVLATSVVIWSVMDLNNDPVVVGDPSHQEIARGEPREKEPVDDMGKRLEEPLVASAAPLEPVADEQPTRSAIAMDLLESHDPLEDVVAAEMSHTLTMTPEATDMAGELGTVAMMSASAQRTGFETEQQLTQQATQVAINVQTRDFDRSVQQLNTVVRNIDRAQLEPLVEADASAATDGQIAFSQRMRTMASPAQSPETDPAGSAPAPPAPASASAFEMAVADADNTQGNAAGAAAPPTASAMTSDEPAPVADVDDAPESINTHPRTSPGYPSAELTLRPDMHDANDTITEPMVERPRQAQRVAYNLIVPADQLDKAVELLRDAQNNGYQHVQFNREQVVTHARRNWPRPQPDYGDILRQQLPQDPPPAAQDVIIRVYIEETLAD